MILVQSEKNNPRTSLRDQSLALRHCPSECFRRTKHCCIIIFVDCFSLCPALFDPKDEPMWRRMVNRRDHRDSCRAIPLRLSNPKLNPVAVAIAVSSSETSSSLLQRLLSTENLTCYAMTSSCFFRAIDTKVWLPPLLSASLIGE